MRFHMSAETLGQFLQIKRLIKHKDEPHIDLRGVEFLTHLFQSCGKSRNPSLISAADQLWTRLTADNPEIEKRKKLNQLHSHLPSRNADEAHDQKEQR